MDHDLVVLSIDWLLDEGLLEDVAANDDTVIVLLHVVLQVLK